MALDIPRLVQTNARNVVELIARVEEFLASGPPGLAVELENQGRAHIPQKLAHACEDLPFCALDIDLDQVDPSAVRSEVRIQRRCGDLEY